MKTTTPKGKLIILTAPSGAGKTTIVRHLLNTFEELSFSVSATNRPVRNGEINGKDYYFLSTSEFLSKIKNDEFIEWEEVYDGRFYGTLKSEVERLWSLGKHVVFDIEVKGATNLKKAFPENSMAIFVKPPSKDVLFERLRNRKTENSQSLEKRMQRAAMELDYENSFDKVLLNDDLPTALEQAKEMVVNFLNL